jgi:all-trans-retinol 13,14-reductase
MKYDVVIIGSGLGGLQCAYMLGKEGYHVCVLEKNKVLGGCLQTFTRSGSIFDTGMHYIGGLDKGQVLEKFFRYFDLTGKLKLKRLDEDGYDVIRHGDREYKFAMGYERFKETLLEQFPGERSALDKYVDKLKEINSSVDIYNMREFSGSSTEYLKYYGIGIDQFYDSITGNQALKNLLGGLAPLYAGIKGKSPLYIPMMIHSSYIEGAYRFIDGGSQLSDHLANSITDFGGTIFKNAEVTKLISDKNKISSVEVNHTYQIEADHVISGIHPKALFSLVDDHIFKPAYRKRIREIEETYGMFSLYLSMKKDTFRYVNNNYYCYHTDDLWNAHQYDDESWPKGYMIHFSPVSSSEQFTNTVIVNTVMKWDEMRPWMNTHVENRGQEYREFKQKKAEKLMELLEKDFPGIRSAIKLYYTSTPLTYRDYTGTWEGSVYGMLKDYNHPMKTLVLPRTHLKNLLLTGQNINVHGVVGVTIGSFLTCSELLGKQYLIDKIRHAK